LGLIDPYTAGPVGEIVEAKKTTYPVKRCKWLIFNVTPPGFKPGTS